METLAVIEVLDRSGQVIVRERVTALPAIVGRAYDATLILDDPFVAAHHLQIDVADDGQISVSDLGSENRFSIPRRPDRASGASVARVSPGEIIRLGHTQIRVWLPDSPIAPEMHVRPTERSDMLNAAGWTIGAVALLILYGWASSTGLNRGGTTGFTLVFVLLLLLTWSGLWWMSSAHGEKRPPFIRHLAIGARMICLIGIGTYAINSVVFAFDVYSVLEYRGDDFVLGVAISHATYAHLRLATRRKRWVSAIQSCVAVAMFLGPIVYVSNSYQLEKYGKFDMPSVMRPAWMVLSEGSTPEVIFDRD